MICRSFSTVCGSRRRQGCARSSPTPFARTLKKGASSPSCCCGGTPRRTSSRGRAIAGALAGVDASALQVPKGSAPEALPKEIIDAYRYVSERLKHRLRNTMLSAQAQASRLRAAAANDAAPDIQVTLAKIDDALLSLSRELEATDADPQHFVQRADRTRRLAPTYGPALHKPVQFCEPQADQCGESGKRGLLRAIICWKLCFGTFG